MDDREPNEHAAATADGRGGEPRDWPRLIHSLLGVPSTHGNRLRVLRNGDEIFPAMLRAIEGATDRVDLVTFVYWRGDIAQRFADALATAARRGCRVRVLIDAVGGRKMNDELIGRMRDGGADVRWFRPIAGGATPEIGEVNHRTHRKVLVCDGSVGFTGGVGIADEWAGDARNEHEWRDTHLEVRGPAVAGLQAAFLDNWIDDADEPFDAADEPPASNERAGESECTVIRDAAETGASDLRILLLALLTLAQRRVRIAAAYFNPDDQLLEALCRASERGVDVQLLLPGEHADKRFVQLSAESAYTTLLERGVTVKCYERSMMHAKIVIVDGEMASVGSANLNRRSMEHDDECNLLVFDPGVVAVLDAQFDDDLEVSVDLDPERWAQRGVIQRLGESITGVAERWL